MKVAFLYTLPHNKALFAPYIEDLQKEAEVSHHVKEELLTDPQEKAVHDALEAIENSDEPDIIVCTCSSIGGMADSFSSASSTKILRVDRAMAEAAVVYSEIDVLAALESTLQPTKELLEECAKQKGTDPKVELTVVPEAWADYYEKDDMEGYAQTIATYILEKYGAEPKNREKHVIVLAQASMSPAVDIVETARRHQVRLSDTNSKMLTLPKILASPEICMERLQEQIAGKQ